MNLKIQLISLGFSFLFGFVFSILVKVNYKILFLSRKGIQILSNFLFLLDMSLCYFLIFRYINGGILHIYFLLLFLCGCYCGKLFLNFFFTK